MNIWKRKLLAYLHDPPQKALRIQHHERPRDTLIRNVWPDFDPAEYRWFFDKVCDHVAAAADRMIFPTYNALSAPFTGKDDHPFKHPLGGGTLVFENGAPSW